MAATESKMTISSLRDNLNKSPIGRLLVEEAFDDEKLAHMFRSRLSRVCKITWQIIRLNREDP